MAALCTVIGVQHAAGQEPRTAEGAVDALRALMMKDSAGMHRLEITEGTNISDLQTCASDHHDCRFTDGRNRVLFRVSTYGDSATGTLRGDSVAITMTTWDNKRNPIRAHADTIALRDTYVWMFKYVGGHWVRQRSMYSGAR
jgi:hypothetical protein